MHPSRIVREGSATHGRYSLRLDDGSQAELTFIQQAPGVVAITHTYTPPKHRGQGIAARVVERAIADFRSAGLKVVPACWFARDQFREHPDWADLLHQG